MSLIFKVRSSDSPYIESITYGETVGDASPTRPAECNWHMVFIKQQGRVRSLFVAPLTTSGVVSWTEGAEMLWVRFTLGTFMPHLPARRFLDLETVLPDAASHSFWLNGSAWQQPDFENVEAFVNRLVRQEVLVRDPIVDAALQDSAPNVPDRTIRHRFLHTTGLSQNTIRQIVRSKQAAALLRQGVSINDTVYEVGYFDQPHLTRSLKRFIGSTPAQLLRSSDSG